MALREDRAALMSSDTIRSLILVLLTAAVLFVYLKRQSKITWITSLVSVLILSDMVGVDRRYVNNNDFVTASFMNQSYQKNDTDMEILKDEGHFRVFDLTRKEF